MDENRRSFLKKAGSAMVGLGCSMQLLGTGCNSLKHDHEDGPPANQLAMVIDIEKCLKKEVRDACVTACNTIHNIPPACEDEEREIKWIWTEHFNHAFPGEMHAQYAKKLETQPVLVLCNHCSEPACTKVCPTGATWKRKQDGLVMMDMHRCIGCRYCIVGCPYGARSFNWEDARPGMQGKLTSNYPLRAKGVVEKCTFCADRIRVNREPACVEASRKVPGGEGALTFGNLSDEKSAVVKLLREKRTIARLLNLGTKPNVYYIV